MKLQYSFIIRAFSIQSMSIIINCAGDTSLAERIYEHILSKTRLNTEFVSIREDEIEIDDKRSNLTNNDMKNLLEEYLRLNAELKDYSATQFGNLFTVGIVSPDLKNELLTCEMCGYTTPFFEELFAHRRAHGI